MLPSPRVVGDARARALCADMKRCSYYETCATYGLNVDRVFQEGEAWPSLACVGEQRLRYSSGPTSRPPSVADRKLACVGGRRDQEVREDLLNSHRSFWAGGAGKATVTRVGACYLLGISQSWARNGGLGYLPCSYLLPLPSPSGPEVVTLQKATAASGCLQVPQLPEPLSSFHSCSWAGESGFHGQRRAGGNQRRGW